MVGLRRIPKPCLAVLLMSLMWALAYAITCQHSDSTWAASLSALAKIEGTSSSDSSGYTSALVKHTWEAELACPTKRACVEVGSQFESGGYCSYIIDDPHASKSFYPAGSYTYADASELCGNGEASTTAYLSGYCGV